MHNDTINATISLQFDRTVELFKLRFAFDDGTTDLLIVPVAVADAWQQRHNLVVKFDGEPVKEK